MKKAKDIVVGDKAFMHDNCSGKFLLLGEIKEIYPPGIDGWCIYRFMLDIQPRKTFAMPSSVCVSGEYMDYTVIVPESELELETLNNLLDSQTKYVKQNIVSGIKNLLDIDN